ncbi:FkbM family methyltransferase [Hanstruepera marina]|uniref:FkbM family methyltransferase n=1 Tax=Hanstruepera marina TaxID=2873265 RepID=UPI001CA71BFF|nr:FkbM family methyltransferase [Hanstruepera marina]
MIKKKIKKIFEGIAFKYGYTKHNNGGKILHKNNLLASLFINVKEMGFLPKHIVDVGANHGTWTRETLKYFPNAYYTLIEPQKWLQTSFQDLLDANEKISVKAVGLGAQKGNFLFTLVNRDDSCSFRYTEEEANEKGFKQIQIPVETLNNIVSENEDIPLPDIVKIDAEGLDIEVLKGADKLFGKTEIFMVEASVNCKIFENSVLRMINFMDRNGYTLFDITDLNKPFKPYVLWLVELVFIKKGGVLDSFKIDVNL